MGKNKLTPEQELEVISLYQQQLTAEKIGGMYGVCHGTIISTLKKHNIKPRKPTGRNKEKIITPEQELEIIKLYQQGLTIQKIAPMYDLSVLPVANILHKNNIEVSKSTGRKAKLITPEKEAEIISLYQQGFNLKKITTIYGVSPQRIKEIIEKNNIVIRTSKSYNIKLTPEKEAEIINLYQQGFSLKKIVDICNLSDSSVFKALHKNNVETNKIRGRQPKVVTPEQELEVINLYQQGFNTQEVSNMCKIPKATITKKLKQNNITIRNYNRNSNPNNYSLNTTREQELEIINLYKQGHSVELIASICKIPHPVVRNRLKKHNTIEKLQLS